MLVFIASSWWNSVWCKELHFWMDNGLGSWVWKTCNAVSSMSGWIKVVTINQMNNVIEKRCYMKECILFANCTRQRVINQTESASIEYVCWLFSAWKIGLWTISNPFKMITNFKQLINNRLASYLFVNGFNEKGLSIHSH